MIWKYSIEAAKGQQQEEQQQLERNWNRIKLKMRWAERACCLYSNALQSRGAVQKTVRSREWMNESVKRINSFAAQLNDYKVELSE